LQQLVGERAVLYPQREGLGADEPHVEIAGERIETIAALLSGRARVVVTTARASAERTGVPRVLETSRLELATGDRSPVVGLTDVAQRLADMGYERVPGVTEVGQFSVRGGILDVYGFGMAAPARVEWWGDEIVSLRGFDLDTQRSAEPIDRVSVLPIRTGEGWGMGDEGWVRTSLLDLLPADTLLVVDQEAAIEREVDRAWADAAHHLEVARRLGEEPPPRADLMLDPETWRARVTAFARIAPGAADAIERFPLLAPEAVDRDVKRLRQIVVGETPTVILCDNEGQLERLEEILGTHRATLVVGAVD